VSFSEPPEPDPGSRVYVYPYATADHTEGYSGSGFDYNLAWGNFSNDSYSVTNYVAAEGDLAIRIHNWSGSEITIAETVVTLGLNIGSTDINLPEFTLPGYVSTYGYASMHFWVAGDGSSYYANVTPEGVGTYGGPTMSAGDSIAGGYIAAEAIPEPATMLLLGFGMLFLPRKKR
jgi:hypothetical protein